MGDQRDLFIFYQAAKEDEIETGFFYQKSFLCWFWQEKNTDD